MFKWLKRKKAIPPEQTEAYQLGRRAAESMAGDLDAYMRRRFDPVFEDYLNVLRGTVQRCFRSDEAPPLTLAGIEYQIFLENVEEMKPKMKVEISDALAEWSRTFDEIGMQSEVEVLIESRIDQFCTDLSLAGLKLLTDYAEGLKDADIQWRKANPVAAADFPEE